MYRLKDITFFSGHVNFRIIDMETSKTILDEIYNKKGEKLEEPYMLNAKVVNEVWHHDKSLDGIFRKYDMLKSLWE